MSAPAIRVAEANARAYRYIWKGSVVTTFVNPVLFLLSMGLGFGTLVERGARPEAIQGFEYIAFIAPALIVATAMQTGATDGSWPVMAGIKWIKTYHAALATPVGVGGLVAGNFLWVFVKLIFSSLAFVLVATLFGALSFVDGLAAVPAAVLTGMAFLTPMTAITAMTETEVRLTTIFRFGIIPMFLLSGTFFPVSQLPGWIEPVAYLTPLWHGVELGRAASLGIDPIASISVHVAYLLVWMVAGWAVARWALARRLLP